MVPSTKLSFRQHEAAVRGAVFRALDHKPIFNAVNKLTTIVGNETISTVMLTRLVLPTRDLELNIINGLRAGVYSDDTFVSAELRESFVSLGQKRSWEIVVTAGVETIIRPLLRDSAITPREFMRHAIATGTGAARIADYLDLPASPLFVAGLYHNIGLAVMANSFPDKYSPEILSNIPGNPTIQAYEAVEFGFTHEDAGALFLMAASFPDSAWHAAATHHSNQHTSDLVTATVRLSSNLAHQIGCRLGLPAPCNNLHPTLLSDIGLGASTMAEIANDMAVADARAANLP